MTKTTKTQQDGKVRITCTCGYRTAPLRPSVAKLAEAGHNAWHAEHPGETYPLAIAGRRTSTHS